MRTRWGESRPLRKCAILSLIAHLLFVAYMTTVHIVAGPPQDGFGPTIRISALDELTDDSIEPDRAGEPESPWDRLAADVLPDAQLPAPEPPRGDDIAKSDEPSTPQPAAASESNPQPPVLEPAEPAAKVAASAAASPIDAPPAQRQAEPDVAPTLSEPPRPMIPDAVAATPKLPRASDSALSPQIAEPPLPQPDAALASPQDTMVRRDSPLKPTDVPNEAIGSFAEEGLEPVSPRRTAPPNATASSAPAVDVTQNALKSVGNLLGQPTRTADARNASSAAPAQPSTGSTRAQGGANSAVPSGGATRAGTPHVVPKVYTLRGAPDRTQVASSRGGSPQTEAAVKAALRWLAANQSPDGHWDASRFGAGRETKTLDHDRHGAGAQADTAMTGLTLLAFMGAGHTHQAGSYQPSVQRGLDYLISVQAVDGNLAGQAEVYAFMYSHGIATMALSEAYALSGDSRLLTPVRRALAYTIAAQNRTTGGFRYRPGEEGDTSQLGWQLMALKSAELGGIPIPTATRDGMVRFLHSVSSGPNGGLASYRPRERATPTMTAEALVCRQFLGIDRTAALTSEAANFVLTELPGQGKANFYYWYYATLGLYQLQNANWTRWNEALTATLTSSQRRDGDLAGSWDPDEIWGGYGGRVYSTSLGVLCLEVYYRYLPLYTEAATRDRQVR